MHGVLKTGERKREVQGLAILARPLALHLRKTTGGSMNKVFSIGVLVALFVLPVFAQETASWDTSVHGYVWVGSRYWGGIANAEFDSRPVAQGGVNVVLQKRGTQVVLKTWFSGSTARNAAGERFTGNAQEFDLGVDLVQKLGHGWAAKVGYSHFFITKSAGSDVEMLVVTITKDVVVTERHQITTGMEFYDFVPTHKTGPAGGQFYLPNIAYSFVLGKVVLNTGAAVAFNSNGAFGLRSERTVRVTAQLLWKLPKGSTGPDVTYGGSFNSKQRPMRTTVGWSWIF